MDNYGRHGESTYQENQGYATTTKTTYTYNFGSLEEFSTRRRGETNGFPAGYTGTLYVEVPPYIEPKRSQSWFAGNWLPDFKLFLSWLLPWLSLGGGGANTKPHYGGGSSAGSERHDAAQKQKPPTYDKGQDREYEHFRQSHNDESSGDFRSRDHKNGANGANGHHFGEVNSTWGFGDLQHRSARNESPVNDSEVLNLRRKVKKLERHMELAAKDYKEMAKNFYGMEMQASKQEDRANGLEKENRSLEKENRESQENLKVKGQEMGDLQLRLQHLSAAHVALEEKHAAEVRKFEHFFEDIRRENQELKKWKSDQEEERERELNTSELMDTKVLVLTTANGQLEDKKQLLTKQVEEQAKRIQELKQQVSAQGLKLGTTDSETQSLRERLREERDKSAKLNEELKQRSIRVEDLMRATQDLQQHNLTLMAQVTNRNTTQSDEVDDHLQREQALKAQYSALEAKAELETLSLRTRLREESEKRSKLSERLQQCDLQIDELKHQIQDLKKRDSESVELVPPPKEYTSGDSFLETQATPYLLDRAVHRVHEVAGIFARLLMKAMEQGRIDGMAVARNNFVRSVSVGKAAPLKYVLEAITCKLLFQGFEHECFDLQDSTSGFLDMEQQRMDNFRRYKYLTSLENPEQLVLVGDSFFTHFCRVKLENLSAAIPEIESMVKEIISRTFEPSSSEDTSTDVATYLAAKLGTTFVKLAVCVWQVHKLAFSFNPMARIFRVSQSEKFVEKYMESVIFQESESDEEEDMPSADMLCVDFTVVPGFLINRIVVRSRVFVVKPPSGALRFPILP